jgi:hypothetical protein
VQIDQFQTDFGLNAIPSGLRRLTVGTIDWQSKVRRRRRHFVHPLFMKLEIKLTRFFIVEGLNNAFHNAQRVPAAMNEIVQTKREATRIRWEPAGKDKAYDLFRGSRLIRHSMNSAPTLGTTPPVRLVMAGNQSG